MKKKTKPRAVHALPPRRVKQRANALYLRTDREFAQESAAFVIKTTAARLSAEFGHNFTVAQVAELLDR